VETERTEGIGSTIVVRVVVRHGRARSGRWGVLRSEV